MLISRFLTLFKKDSSLKKIILIAIFILIFGILASAISLYYGYQNKEIYEDIKQIQNHQRNIQNISSLIIKNKLNIISFERNSLNY